MVESGLSTSMILSLNDFRGEFCEGNAPVDALLVDGSQMSAATVAIKRCRIRRRRFDPFIRSTSLAAPRALGRTRAVYSLRFIAHSNAANSGNPSRVRAASPQSASSTHPPRRTSRRPRSVSWKAGSARFWQSRKRVAARWSRGSRPCSTVRGCARRPRSPWRTRKSEHFVPRFVTPCRRRSRHDDLRRKKGERFRGTGAGR